MHEHHHEPKPGREKQRRMEESAESERDGESHGEHHAMMVRDYRRRFWVSLILTIPILALSPMIQQWFGFAEAVAFPGDRYVLFALASALYFYGGWPFLRGLTREVGSWQPGMMTLVGVAITVSYLYSALVTFGLPGEVFYWELATLIDVMLLGHWLEMRSVMGASNALEELIKLMPNEAHRVNEDGSVEDVEVSQLNVGDVVQVRPGEKLPVDGEVTEGRTTVDESMVTGESRPVEKGEADTVIGGAVNGEGSVRVRVEKTGADTYLNQVVEMVRQAQQTRSRTQNLADRTAFFLTVVALTVGPATLVTWLLLGSVFVFALERMVTVMVITCPHALGLAVPLVVAVSTSLGARSGLLIRNRGAFESARAIDAIVFDKTGTLTQGKFGVTDIATFGDRLEDDVLSLAAAIEGRSEHPIARAIADTAAKKGLSVSEPEDFSAIPGKGARGIVDGRDVKVVSPGYLRENNIETPEHALSESEKTVVYVLVDDEPAGAVALADIVREESRDAIKQLKEMGIQVLMITGDSERVAAAVAAELGLDDFFAQVLPDQKASRIRELKDRGLRVAMVGDGINDAPALAEADVGIAIGAGTHVAMESADVVLVNSDPRDALRTIQLAHATHRKMVQNLWWAAGYNIVAIPLAAGVLAWAGIILAPAAGAALMSLSTIIVAINARLLGRWASDKS